MPLSQLLSQYTFFGPREEVTYFGEALPTFFVGPNEPTNTHTVEKGKMQ
jgi:hypothetical protein